MKKALNFAWISLMLAANFAPAQDFHLSQYDAATLYMNPANTGMYADEKSEYRIYSDYRSQWGAIGARPFSTAYIAFDMPVEKWGRQFGLGGYIIDNNAGVGNFNTVNAVLSAAYNILNNTDGKHYLTTGIQIGILYNSFNPANFSYDNQYSSSLGGFDNSMPSGENIPATSMIRLDANYGLFYKFIDKEKKIHPYAGFSIQHVNEPNMTIIETETRLAMRFNYLLGCDYQLSEKLKISPRLLYMDQGGATELTIGSLLYYKMLGTYEVLGGLEYRLEDAFIVHLGVKYGQNTFRFSYDANTSYLNTYSNGKGAWEFSVILSSEKGKPLFGKRSKENQVDKIDSFFK